MQIKVTIALVAAAFALASYPAFGADMPVDGTKNFTAPGGAPSYFANETVPASARVANQATFTDDEVMAPEFGQSATDRGSAYHRELGRCRQERDAGRSEQGQHHKTCQIEHPPPGGGSPAADCGN